MNEYCVCPTNFSGPRCESCAAIQCLNGGTCRITFGAFDKYRCSCLDGFEGLFCEIDRCRGYCKNGGTCNIHPVTGPKCDCHNNYSGENCEVDDLCRNSNCDNNYSDCLMTCQNDGYCQKDVEGMDACVCVGEWSGKSCETPPECIDNECGKCSESSAINECL